MLRRGSGVEITCQPPRCGGGTEEIKKNVMGEEVWPMRSRVVSGASDGHGGTGSARAWIIVVAVFRVGVSCMACFSVFALRGRGC